jgi:hypothetical protein
VNVNSQVRALFVVDVVDDDGGQGVLLLMLKKLA